MRALYLTYDGVMEPIGQSQVLQYLCQLAREHQIWLISFEKAGDWRDVQRRERTHAQVKSAGIGWFPMRYHKRPTLLATAYDVLAATLVSLFLVLRHRIRIVHARGYVTSVAALVLKKLLGVRFIFDMRGFWADGRIDDGAWTADSLGYRLTKRFEQSFLRNADVVVSLTNAGADAIRQFPYLSDRVPPIEVIRTCANPDMFRPSANGTRAAAPFVLGHVGSTGQCYLFEPALQCFEALRAIDGNARMLIVNRGQHDFIWDRLRSRKIDPALIEVKAVPFESVSAEIGRMQAGVFFLKETFAQKARCPTKLAEFLSCGVPCLANDGAGDIEQILERNRVGVVLKDFSSEAIVEATHRLSALARDAETPLRCIDAARRYFSLEAGVSAYSRIYQSLHS